VRQSLSERFQKFVEEGPQIIEDLRRAAAEELEVMKNVSESAKEMLNTAQQMLQKAREQMEKARQ
jgi:hypothetical protein